MAAQQDLLRQEITAAHAQLAAVESSAAAQVRQVRLFCFESTDAAVVEGVAH